VWPLRVTSSGKTAPPAFNRVCDILLLSCDVDDPLTEFVVTKSDRLAKAGVRDPEVLYSKVLAALGTSSDDVTQRAPLEIRASSVVLA
jgi:hypothetical protein